MNIIQALDDPNIFGPFFRGRESWHAWRVFLRGLFGLGIDTDGLPLWAQCTGREAAPSSPANESWLICGRRSGKSFVLAVIAVFLACFRDWRPHLGPGERGVIMVLAADRRQARVIHGYVRGLITRIPMLASVIKSETAESVELQSGVVIEVHAANYRSVRGYTVIAALCDELAFWRSDESANPDREILAAIRPAMATIPSGMLLVASSPYARRGELWRAYRRHWGQEGAPLVWKAPTAVMNPSVPESVITEAYESDPGSAAAEYGAEFRTDVDSFVSREAIEACTDVGILERPPVSALRYVGFTDPSGGSSDAFTLAIAHPEKEELILDALREVRPPFSPELVVLEFAALLKTYCISTIRGDRYAGEWPRERFREAGIEYKPAEKPKSDLYRDLLPHMNSGRVRLLDHARLTTQLIGLERRTARGGRDSIDHPPGAHDDLANSAAGALLEAIAKKRADYSNVQVFGLYRKSPNITGF